MQLSSFVFIPVPLWNTAKLTRIRLSLIVYSKVEEVTIENHKDCFGKKYIKKSQKIKMHNNSRMFNFSGTIVRVDATVQVIYHRIPEGHRIPECIYNRVKFF